MSLASESNESPNIYLHWKQLLILLFNLFINYGIESMLIQFADYTNLGDEMDVSEGRTSLETDGLGQSGRMGSQEW